MIRCCLAIGDTVMLGSRGAEQLEFFAGSLRDLIPDDHVLARVDRVLDLSWLHAIVKHSRVRRTRPVTMISAVRLRAASARRNGSMASARRSRFSMLSFITMYCISAAATGIRSSVHSATSGSHRIRLKSRAGFGFGMPMSNSHFSWGRRRSLDLRSRIKAERGK